jgi:hypothetical protein
MITERRSILEPLFHSQEGLHLSVYLVNRGDPNDVKSQLRRALNHARECLEPVLSEEALDKFLNPVLGLLADARVLQGVKGHIGIFRNEDSFRILSIPIEVEFLCTVATTFHVKPLLRWLQMDREFLLLGLEPGVFHLYQGSQHALRRLEIKRRPQPATQESPGASSSYRPHRELMQEVMDWLNEWLTRVPNEVRPKLYVVGESTLCGAAFKRLRVGRAVRLANYTSFHQTKLADMCQDIRRALRKEARQELERAFIEYRCAAEMNLTTSNMDQIAQAAIQGQVRKLIIADGMHIFGKLHPETGRLTLHPRDMDHEDDDILDDLAQTVLAHGGNVLVASRHQLPQGRPALAILDHEKAAAAMPAPAPVNVPFAAYIG